MDGYLYIIYQKEGMTMRKILSLYLAIAAFLTTSSAAMAEENGEAVSKGTVTVGINAEFKPFEYYNNEELTGFDIELMNRIGEITGYDIDYVDMPFEELVPSLSNGDIDCVISAFTITDERKKNMDFTIPYLTADVTYNNGETVGTTVENYAIVFPDNSVEKSKIVEASGDPDPTTYTLFNNAVIQLIEDGTITGLIEKYELNKPFDEEAEYNYEYKIVYPTEEEFQESAAAQQADSEVAVSAPSEWAMKSIDAANAMGIIDQTQKYVYSAPITREQFCDMIYNYINILEIDIESASSPFTDTDSEKIAALNKMGIINGKTETEFAPNDNLTREEAAVILNRMINETIPVAVTEMYFVFDDEDEISDWAGSAVQVMCNMGVMNGVGENNFAPNDSYTVEQAITTIMRVYAAQQPSIGIIGGADGPTEIIVSGVPESVKEVINIEPVERTAENETLYDKGLEIAKTIDMLAESDIYRTITDADNGVSELMDKIGQQDYETPVTAVKISGEYDKLFDLAFNAEGLEINDELKNIIKKKYDFNSHMVSILNARDGVEMIAAASLLSNKDIFLFDGLSEKMTYLYLYDDDFAVSVTFTPYDGGIVEANGMIVKNIFEDTTPESILSAFEPY